MLKERGEKMRYLKLICKLIAGIQCGIVSYYILLYQFGLASISVLSSDVLPYGFSGLLWAVLIIEWIMTGAVEVI